MQSSHQTVSGGAAQGAHTNSQEKEAFMDYGKNNKLPVIVKRKDSSVTDKLLPTNMTQINAEKAAQGEKYQDLEELLGFGRFQYFQIWVFQALVAIFGAMNYFHIVFIVSDPPDWSCSTGEEKCGANGTVCPGGEVVFNTSHPNHLHSLPVQHEWLCSKSLYSESVITATAFGMLGNSLIFGQLCDRLGRTKVFMITNITFIVFRMISFHVTEHFVLFYILTALGTSFFPVGVRAGYTLVAEYCNEKGRRYAFISGWVWWVAGMVVVPFIAQGMNDWYTFGIATTLINLVLVGIYPLVPESPRLLCSKKQFKEAAEIVKKIRSINRAAEVPNLEEVLKRIFTKTKEEKELGTISLFREKSLLKLMICTGLMYCINDYFYFAGQLNAANLAGDMFVNFALLALTEVPAVFIGQFMVDRWGRRWSHVSCMFATTVAFGLNIGLVNLSGTDTAVTTFSIIAKATSNVGWFCMWVQSIETFPTCVRNTGINFSVVLSIIASTTTPFTISLDSVDKRLPYVVFTTIGVIGIIATSLVPETKGATLPETLEEVDDMYRNMKYLELRPWLRRRKTEEKSNIELQE